MDKQFMKLAFDVAKNSKAKRAKVGAIVVGANNKIIGTGYNRMPRNYDNFCEYYDKSKEELITRPELIHAESEAILYCAEIGQCTKGATIYVTHAPCLSCAKLIYQAGISKVYYCIPYRLTDGLEFLRKVEINVEQLIIEL